MRQVNVFATRNKFYDERWIEKQENGFRKWLNFVLTPPEGFAELLGGQADAMGRAGKLDVAKIWQVWSLIKFVQGLLPRFNRSQVFRGCVLECP